MKISNFSETLALWGHLKTWNIFKNFWTFLEPISKGTCRLLGHIKIPIFIFLHRRSMHPNAHKVDNSHILLVRAVVDLILFNRFTG